MTDYTPPGPGEPGYPADFLASGFKVYNYMMSIQVCIYDSSHGDPPPLLAHPHLHDHADDRHADEQNADDRGQGGVRQGSNGSGRGSG